MATFDHLETRISGSRMISLILFDIDGTLIDSAEANWRFHNSLNKKFGARQLSLEEYKKDFYSYPMRVVTKICCPDMTEKQLDEACEYGLSIYSQFHRFIRLNKNVKEGLENLKGKFRLGIVTSRIGIEILTDLGIRKFFEHVITLKDYTKPKPDPEPLIVGLKKFGVHQQEAVYIGDSQKDFDCCRASGVKSIIFGNAAKGDWNITDFMEIPEIIKALNSRNF